MPNALYRSSLAGVAKKMRGEEDNGDHLGRRFSREVMITSHVSPDFVQN